MCSSVPGALALTHSAVGPECCLCFRPKEHPRAFATLGMLDCHALGIHFLYHILGHETEAGRDKIKGKLKLVPPPLEEQPIPKRAPGLCRTKWEKGMDLLNLLPEPWFWRPEAESLLQ